MVTNYPLSEATVSAKKEKGSQVANIRRFFCETVSITTAVFLAAFLAVSTSLVHGFVLLMYLGFLPAEFTKDHSIFNSVKKVTSYII